MDLRNSLFHQVLYLSSTENDESRGIFEIKSQALIPC